MAAAVPLERWRRHHRLDTLRCLAGVATGDQWSHGLLAALLDELHVNDEFNVLVGRVARPPASQYPRLLTIALLIRHSWSPDDLERTARRLGLLRRNASPTPATTTANRHTNRDGAHRRRTSTGAPPSGPRTRAR